MIRDVSMTPFNFLLANKVYFCKQTRPTKKPDQVSSGLQFRVIKTISQKLLSIESDGSITQFIYIQGFKANFRIE
jgi:hypothetical protein